MRPRVVELAYTRHASDRSFALRDAESRLDVRHQRRGRKGGEEGGEEAQPREVEGPHVRLRRRRHLEHRRLVLGVHGKRKLTPDNVRDAARVEAVTLTVSVEPVDLSLERRNVGHGHTF